ncbi:hypothetical protein AAFP35_23195 [Gordonia sp. CPCC 206044]|uniref:hypothetical protein n=1 Tax=Gordonia sp. CPCC 206044 TaxID=3140793 RepID=UPI003AF39679
MPCRAGWVRGTLAAGCLTLGLVLTAACSQPDVSSGASSTTSSATTTPANVYEEQRSAGVRTTLAELGEAITAGDRDRVHELIDPAASPEFRRRLDVAVANLARRGAITDTSSADTSSADTSAADPTTDTTDSAASPPPGRSRPGGSSSETTAPAPPRGTVLRLKELRYEPAPTEEAETLVPAELQTQLDGQGSSDSWVAPIELHYALGGSSTPGIDEPEVVVDTQFVMARYGDSWKVVGDASAIDGTGAPTQLWELPGLAADDVRTAGGTSVIASYPGTAALVDRVRRLLPAAVDRVSAFWGDDWPRRAVVVATDTPKGFGDLAQSASDISAAAAATTFTRIDTEAGEAIGQRVVLTPSAAQLPEPALAVVLRHELTHVAARVKTSPGAPLWITEGVPEYVGRKGTYTRLQDAAPDLASAVRSGDRPTALPTDRDFAIDAQQSQVAYQSAWSVAAFVADRFGEEKLTKLYMGVAGTDDIRRQDVAISGVLGMSRADLVAAWGRWLSAQVR